LRWFNNVIGVYLIQVSLLLIGQQDLGISSGIGPCIPLAGGLCKFYANAGGKLPIKIQPLLVQQTASQSTFTMNNYAPLLISRNDKNEQLT
jgi:hypothetical protein